jgi:WD40 repeat protein
LKKNKVLDYINIKEYITAISYLPTGDMFVVGTHNGRCSIYDCKPKLRYNFSFTCRNRMGKYAYGRKITNIEFVNRTQALITTNDSRIRLVNISDGKLVQKYKGHVNEDYMIKSFSEDDLVISASEEGSVLVWSLKNKENKAKKNYSYEFFRPFKQDTSAYSFLVNDETLADYLKKLFNLTTKVMVYSICLNASISGSLQVLLNCDSIENITF